MDEQDALLRAFRVTETDLDANRLPRQLRMTWFLNSCLVFVLLGAIGIGAGGVYLAVIQCTGVAATAAVTECVQDTVRPMGFGGALRRIR